MDIYLKKEGYGTITGLPYPFDGILTRSPSASQLHFKHLQSHQIPPLKIGGSMEHLNEIPTVPSAVGAGGGAAEATTTTTTTTTTTAWLGNNEKWLMGERVKDDEGSAEVPVAPASTVTNEETVNGGGRDETSTSSDATNLKNEEKTKQRVSKLPRLTINSTRSIRKSPTRSEFRGAATELFPPIKTTTTTTRTTMTSTSDDLIQNIDETQTISDTITSSKVSSRKPPPPPPSQQPSAPSAPSVPTGPSASLQKSNEDEVTTWHQRSFHVTETLSSFKAPQPAPTPAPPILKTKMSDEEKKKLKKEVKIRRFDDDVDINPIAKRKIDPPSRIVSSRSAHLFVDEVAKEDIDDVIARAQLWEKHKKQQKMRQRQTQTSSSINRSSGSVLRSLSAPRHSNRFQFFDPDFD